MKNFSGTFAAAVAADEDSASGLSSTVCSVSSAPAAALSSKGDLDEEATEGLLVPIAEGPVGTPEDGAELLLKRQTSRTP